MFFYQLWVKIFTHSRLKTPFFLDFLMIFSLEQTPKMKKSIMLLKFHHFPMFLKFLLVSVTFFPYFTQGYKASLGPFKISRFTRNFKNWILWPIFSPSWTILKFFSLQEKFFSLQKEKNKRTKYYLQKIPGFFHHFIPWYREIFWWNFIFKEPYIVVWNDEKILEFSEELRLPYPLFLEGTTFKYHT